MSIRRIAAVGSSFAAGPTIPPVVDPAAMRSGRNYPHLLAATLGVDLIDLTVSGATTSSILDTPQQTVAGRIYPPQVHGVPTDADVVTITAGGNDLQLIGSMLHAAWSAVDPGGPMAGYLGAGLGNGIRDGGEDDVSTVAAGLIRIVAAVRDRAPRARVILVDYLTVVSEATVQSAEAPFTDPERVAFSRLEAALAAAYVPAAHESGAELLRVSSASSGHGLGSLEPWVFGFRPSLEDTAGSFHPNLAGMRAVADHLAKALLA